MSQRPPKPRKTPKQHPGLEKPRRGLDPAEDDLDGALDDLTEREAPAVPIGDRYLDMKQARAELNRLGIHVSDRKMREIVRERRLPFFKSVDSRLRIGRRILHRCIEERQEAASREFEQANGANQPNQGET